MELLLHVKEFQSGLGWTYNTLIGITKRKSTRVYQIHKKINLNWVAIDRATVNLSRTDKIQGLQLIRTQIPLVAANGMTIFKSQGSSISQVVVHVKRHRKPVGKLSMKLTRESLYVACSRATSLQGLFIDGKFEPPTSPPPSDPVTIEMDRLRITPYPFTCKFLQDFEQGFHRVYYQNIQSFAAHYLDVLSDNCAKSR